MKKSLLVFALLLMATSGFAKWPGFLQRYEISYGYPVVWAQYSRTDRIVSPINGGEIDTTITKNVRTAFSFGGWVGSFIPIAKMGKKAVLTLDINFGAAAYLWDFNTLNYGGYTTDGFTYQQLPYGGFTESISVPIGFSLRHGCDAQLTKNKRLCWNVGIGALPSYNLSTDLDNAAFTAGVQPYIKGEFGIRAGVCWKLRAMFAMGNITYLDADKNGLFGTNFSNSSSKLIGKRNLTLSLVINPFAFTWKRQGFWNTYR